MQKEVRTRFAPSPTGGLHLGGVRTALYSYLYAKKHQGKFVLRIEDTDQHRFVEGAEQYIIDCLQWCGISPDEGPHLEGPYAPYRQSERKESYRAYALQLIEKGHAYYAFDTQEELEKMRATYKTASNPSPQYDHLTRLSMKNSLTLSQEEVNVMLQSGIPYVIRILMPENEIIQFHDLIRGEIRNESKLVDDKVLLKADGMPTYHLAVVVDDYLMKITHAFRGEEWLPSAPVHVMLWRYLGWENDMPAWAHLPLILKPDGNGKLSKRDGDRLGFPVFAMNWKDPITGDIHAGFKELGFLPQAFLNLLALLGWNSGEEQEIFTKEDLINHFSIERIHKGGAKFDFEKAKWFNHEWIKKIAFNELEQFVMPFLKQAAIPLGTDDKNREVISLARDRCTLLTDFIQQCAYFYLAPKEFDLASISSKWSVDKTAFFKEFVKVSGQISSWTTEDIEASFKALATEKGIKVGELQLPFRIMLVGGKFGPGVFQIAQIIGQVDTMQRVEDVLNMLDAKN
ncbi:MAG: glutamate--tRNA ligase [Chitinophagaceae bacterium]|nr:glutamate--tRNA ligase [Chitinophagaceae bacterium]